ncbi:TPA: lytic transglycosylase domain-containing protein [Acinetobacter baumannii]|uniref:lytic transglycosylase domain-containing protein n=1 Tax=Acinetobacter baumannii TaxID=470 RepID=UPI0022232362|nr:lytic transglycosylase domain-containing protein [Acinetobacter baumannii]MCW1490302.1 lytic transglycosylase domain-containing protein [Acinetobacter baumannii]
MIDFVVLAQQCAPQVDVNIASAIVKSESSFNPFAIGVNRAAGLKKQPTSYEEAVTVAKRLISQGRNIDVGFAQINSANFKRLNLSVEQVFDPCTNLSAMQFIFNDCRNKAKGKDIYKAMSCYNTGNHSSGFRNGYVAKVSRNLNYFANGSLNTMPVKFNPPSSPMNSSEQFAYFATSADMPNSSGYTENTELQSLPVVEKRPSFFLTNGTYFKEKEKSLKSSMIF